jgi:hypothetical protein
MAKRKKPINMNYAKLARKITGSCYLVYRGCSSKVLPSGEVQFGSLLFPSKEEFKRAVDNMYEELAMSIK